MIKKLALAATMFVSIGTAAYSQEIQAQKSYPYTVTKSGNFNVSWAYDAINLNAATSLGLTGNGITVAVFDTGLNVNNPKFSGNMVTGYNLYCNNKKGCAGVTGDNQWHGTFVSSIIAANTYDPGGNTMYGVANQAKIMPIQILDSKGTASFTGQQLAKSIEYATRNKAKIYNNSWNSSLTFSELGITNSTLRSRYAFEIKAWQDAVLNGGLIVFAAGNFGKKDPGFYASLPSNVPGLENGWIVAVATDQTGALASWSNACGIASAYCMAAPGSNIVGLYGTGVGVGSGTSFAAPIISGSAALLYQYWPSLTTAQIRDILFRTADKSGIYANTAIYGQGMLDLTKAFQPVGTVSVANGATVNGSKTSVNNTYVVTNSAFGNSIVSALSDKSVMVLDEYNRDYSLDISKGVVNYDSFSIEDQMSIFGSNVTESDGVYSFSGYNDDEVASFSTVNMDNGFSISYSNNLTAGLSFGPFAENHVKPNELVMLDSVANPYMNVLDNGSGYVIGYDWSEKSTTRFGVITNLQMIDDILDDTENVHQMFGANIEHTFKNEKFNVNINLGMLNEQNSVLGNYSDGALNLGASANTVFAGIGMGYNVTETVSVIGGANFGYTLVNADNNSMIKDVDNLTSGSAYFGAVKTGIFNDTDRFGIIGGVPLTTVSGTANAMLPVSRDIDGNVSYDQVDIDLENTAPEYTAQAFYNSKISEYQSFGLGIGARFSQSEENNTELVGMFKYKLQF